MTNIFTFISTDELRNLYDGEMLVRVITDNSSDELYAIVDSDMDEDELNDELRRSLRHYKGKWVEFGGYEDASYIIEQRESAEREADEAWDGEGYYVIGWSDGGEDWTSDGPVWFDVKEELRDELVAAYSNATETHLPGAERVEVDEAE